MTVKKMNKRYLILEDGTVFTGEGFGANIEKKGEVIFYNGMTGYQEFITDPSYNGKMVVMTFPLVGAYGINRDDVEAISPHIEGLIVKELASEPSNFRSEESLDSYLRRENIPGLKGIDTRKLTRHLRKKNLRGILTDWKDVSIKELFSESNWPKRSFVKEVSVTKPYIVPGLGQRILVLDLGMKQSVLHELMERQRHVTVVPYNYDAEAIRAFKPDGILLSNGPGNPEDYPEVIETIQTLLGQLPLFGIGLGHQLFALASGAQVKKQAVGFYGKNFSVQDVETGKTWNTNQSRSFYVVEESIATDTLKITYRSMVDGAVEGLSHTKYPAFSVQFHPEGAPGNKETNFLFDRFLQVIEETKQRIGEK